MAIVAFPIVPAHVSYSQKHLVVQPSRFLYSDGACIAHEPHVFHPHIPIFNVLPLHLNC